VSFDVEGGTFTHTGSLCSFETMLRAFALDDPALHTVAEIVHAIDLNDGQYAHPEIPGLSAVLEGWLHAEASDAEREAWGHTLFEGLYQAMLRRISARYAQTPRGRDT
jgi:hypothetical protein